MTSETKTAIKSAEERLEKEITYRLQAEVYDYLKEELTQIESHKERKSFHDNQIRIHEENIKNLKSGNLEAIEKRRKALNAPSTHTFTTTMPGYEFFNTYVAGTTITLNGRTYIF